MALNGIQIFKLTPKKNCKECGCPTCMAFSMKVAQGAMKIEQCPHMSDEALASLSEATAPPMKTIKIGTGAEEHTLGGTSLSAMIPVLQWTPIKLLGQLIYNCIMVIINNLSLMFCVGIAAALAKKNKQQAAIIGLMSYFMYLTAGNVTLTQLGMLAEADPMVGLYGTGQSTVFGIQTVDMGVFGGILLGLVCGWVYNRTCEKQFKGIITQIYSGNRWSFTCMVVFSILFGFGSCFFWPPVQNVISALTDLIATSGNFARSTRSCDVTQENRRGNAADATRTAEGEHRHARHERAHPRQLAEHRQGPAVLENRRGTA